MISNLSFLISLAPHLGHLFPKQGTPATFGSEYPHLVQTHSPTGPTVSLLLPLRFLILFTSMIMNSGPAGIRTQVLSGSSLRLLAERSFQADLQAHTRKRNLFSFRFLC